MNKCIGHFVDYKMLNHKANTWQLYLDQMIPDKYKGTQEDFLKEHSKSKPNTFWGIFDTTNYGNEKLIAIYFNGLRFEVVNDTSK